jgi:hypothetical protein
MTHPKTNTWRKLFVAFLLVVALAVGGTRLGASSVHAAAARPLAATCTYTAWYRVLQTPTFFGKYGSQNTALYATKDIYDGAFCGYLHSATNYSFYSGNCGSVTTEVFNGANGIVYGNKTVGPCVVSGSIQSPFVHVIFYTCWVAEGWLDNHDAEENTGCYNVG